MLLLRLWNYIRGYVIILVEGYFLEKFINICIRRQIFLWDIKRQKDCKMVLKISIKGFKLLRPVAAKTGCRVRILKKRGLPFVLSRYKRRKTFIVGAVLFVLLFYILTSYIWAIEVTGNKNLETQFIVDKLAEIGVKPGVLKYNINTDKVVNGLMLEVKELGWVGVVVKGTKVKVDVVERVMPPELVPKNVPCNIVARRDGVIKSMIVKLGQEQVKAGDTVTKGQVLISGTVKGQDEKAPPRLVHATGIVKARTWYETGSPVKLKVLEKERTENSKDNYTLVLLARQIKLFRSEAPFEDYEKVELRKKISVGEDLTLPFEFIINRYYEVKTVEKEIDIEDAKQIAADEAHKELMKEIPENADIVKTNLNYVTAEDGEITAVVTAECTEDIGFTEEIGGE